MKSEKGYCGWECACSGGITTKEVEFIEDDQLYMEAGGAEGENRRRSTLGLARRRVESSCAGRRSYSVNQIIYSETNQTRQHTAAVSCYLGSPSHSCFGATALNKDHTSLARITLYLLSGNSILNSSVSDNQPFLCFTTNQLR